MHLTNYAINKQNPNYNEGKKPTFDDGHKRSFTSILKILQKKGYQVNQLKKDIDKLIILTIASIQAQLNQHQQRYFYENFSNDICFHLLGFDILIDSSLKPWLLEVNHLPSLNTETIFDRDLKYNLVKDVINIMNIQCKDNRSKYKSSKIEDMYEKLYKRKQKISKEDRLILQENEKQKRDIYIEQNNGRFRNILKEFDNDELKKYLKYQNQIYKLTKGIQLKTMKYFFDEKTQKSNNQQNNNQQPQNKYHQQQFPQLEEIKNQSIKLQQQQINMQNSMLNLKQPKLLEQINNNENLFQVSQNKSKQLYFQPNYTQQNNEILQTQSQLILAPVKNQQMIEKNNINLNLSESLANQDQKIKKKIIENYIHDSIPEENKDDQEKKNTRINNQILQTKSQQDLNFEIQNKQNLTKKNKDKFKSQSQEQFQQIFVQTIFSSIIQSQISQSEKYCKFLKKQDNYRKNQKYDTQIENFNILKQSKIIDTLKAQEARQINYFNLIQQKNIKQ